MTAAAIYGMWKNYRNQAPVEIVMLEATRAISTWSSASRGKAVRGSPSPTRRPAAKADPEAFGDGPTASLRGGTVSFTARFSSTAAALRGPQCSLSPGSWSGWSCWRCFWHSRAWAGPGGARSREVVRAKPASIDPALVEEGARPAAVGNCIACHTVPGGEAFAGGLAVPTQFGTVHSTNITPDEETGIGAWSEEASRAPCTKASTAGTAISIPAFPYDHFTLVTPEDNRALFAYWRTGASATSPATSGATATPHGRAEPRG